MPKQKDLKRIVRSRMQKTGEAYTAARAHVVRRRPAEKEPEPAPGPPPAAAAPPPAVDYAALAGMSDEALVAKTGRDWKSWVEVLDRAGAAGWPHREIAVYLRDLGTPDWWTQMVAVGYERIRGLRRIGQRRDGSYEANKSRTFPVPVDRLFAAFADAGERLRWLPAPVTVKKATATKSIRLLWADGTPCEVTFAAKGPAKSLAAVQHRKLESQERGDELKRLWAGWFDALASRLG